MKAVKPSLARGTRDFLPQVVLRRRHILGTISAVFERYGYAPIETPAMENLSVLQGKYGEEGDRLMFRILNSGDFLEGVAEADRADATTLSSRITEKALRYDLTVPFARFVVMHQNELSFPFKRYQMQPVWRADRPQRGRYREFWQCDADAVGSNSLLLEAEFVHMYAEVFATLGIPVRIHLNNRKLLAAMANTAGAPERLTDFTTALDKLDKIGREAVEAEWRSRGFSDAQVQAFAPVFDIGSDPATALPQLRAWLGSDEQGAQGLAELQAVLDFVAQIPAEGYRVHLALDVTLARGLNYYTGSILEVKPHGTAFQSSIGGGGRYDNLTAAFGGRDLPGVGISFGVDRIYDVLEELGGFPADAVAGPWAMVVHFSRETLPKHLELAALLRGYGVTCEVYPDPAKLGKQFAYADSRGVAWVLTQGPDEISRNEVKLKNMRTGEEQVLHTNMVRILFAPAD